MSKIIEIPFGAQDSKNKGWEYTIPEGMEAVIEDGKVIVREKESEDENLKNKSGYYKAGKFWKASTLWNATKDKIPQRVPNRYILQECVWNIGTLQQFADEIKNVQEVSLDYPIILDMNGNILDGAHRVVKAYLEGKDIDIVYLGDDEWPEPDYDEEKAVKESEDERIRREIYNFAIDMECKEEWINYLEKQKEQKWSPSEGEMRVLYKLCYLSNYITDEDDTDLTRLYQDLKREYFNGHSFENMFSREKQKEQKSSTPEDIAAAYQMGLTKGRNEQKSAEWSEEDSIHLKNAVLSAEKEWGTESCTAKWLKYLPERFNLQPKREWSEEDEKIRKTLLDYYEKALDNYTCVEWLNGITYGELCDWLKSLRPSWKPSEEQIKALQMVKDSHCFMYQKDRVAIEKLLEQIKSL